MTQDIFNDPGVVLIKVTAEEIYATFKDCKVDLNLEEVAERIKKEIEKES